MVKGHTLTNRHFFTERERHFLKLFFKGLLKRLMYHHLFKKQGKKPTILNQISPFKKVYLKERGKYSYFKVVYVTCVSVEFQKKVKMYKM